MTQDHSLEFIVRDYECDSQGIVNNSVYLNYFEHARNQFINILGFNLYDLHKNLNQDPVVVHIDIVYLNVLRGGDRFEVRTRVSRKGAMRMIFLQELLKCNEEKNIPLQGKFLLSAKAEVSVAVLSFGRPLAINKSAFAPLFN